MTSAEIFNRLDEQRSNPGEMLERMVVHFREKRQPMELFEALKMRVRHQLGLQLLSTESEPVRADEVERQLESGLLDACREAGVMLIEDGKVGEGWMYLRPTGDLELARKLIAKIDINDENYDAMIQVLLHEGVDVARGFQAVIDHQGTCNSITLFEQAVQQRSKADRRAAASCLLEHLYHELVVLVRGDIVRREAPADESETLSEMIEKRKWILDEGGYHLDTTHLASTVRIAAILTSPSQLRKAWELTQYGRRLDHQFQYPGDEPFVDFYPAYSAYYQVLLGENVEAGLKMFERKAKSVDATQHGTAAIESYVELLDRVGRQKEAIEAAVTLVPDAVPSQRIVPLLLEIAARANDQGVYEPILDYCRKHNDIIGYAAVTHVATSS
ncbi:hypothetical protein Pla52o_40900 [Novipirellula galeiformis]|uniref:Uncharacterized protein n=1 Tax=Novipirellula galeiformis TaxID=2528004 RepID=A0A5C6CA34_9BACT|nr:hypothetical protein [Novipirellula galeiformis]TWU21058.1 hypothetical protein Pla52o_40900 [Novipirellula galeiformis]